MARRRARHFHSPARSIEPVSSGAPSAPASSSRWDTNSTPWPCAWSWAWSPSYSPIPGLRPDRCGRRGSRTRWATSSSTRFSSSERDEELRFGGIQSPRPSLELVCLIGGPLCTRGPVSEVWVASTDGASETKAGKATRRDWIGLSVIALPCLLYSMDLTVLDLAVPHLSTDLRPSASELLWI